MLHALLGLTAPWSAGFYSFFNRLGSGKWAWIGASRLRDVHSAHLQLLAMLVMGVRVGFVSLKRPGSGCALGLE